MIPVTVLYEDARDQKTKGFGLHELVVQCVCDALGRASWDLGKLLLGQPKNGANKLRAECQRNMDKLAAKGGWVFAVYDADRIRERIGLTVDACRQSVVDTLKGGCASADHLDVVLLESNLESVLHALKLVAPTLGAEETWRRAIEGKKHDERDRLFTAAARPAPLMRPVREALLAQQPSFARLVARIARVL
jgi:hypothetical protein